MYYSNRRARCCEEDAAPSMFLIAFAPPLCNLNAKLPSHMSAGLLLTQDSNPPKQIEIKTSIGGARAWAASVPSGTTRSGHPAAGVGTANSANSAAVAGHRTTQPKAAVKRRMIPFELQAEVATIKI